jgi:hypothetical protein
LANDTNLGKEMKVESSFSYMPNLYSEDQLAGWQAYRKQSTIKAFGDEQFDNYLVGLQVAETGNCDEFKFVFSIKGVISNG